MATANARYFLPDHPTLKDVYSKNELRAMLVSGTLSRSDMVLDDETGRGHLLGDLLAMPYPDVTIMPIRSTSSSTAGNSSDGGGVGSSIAPRPQLPPNHEFRADTPLPRQENDFRPPSQRRAASREEEDYEERDDAGDDEDEDEEEYEDDTFDEEDDLDEPPLDEHEEDYQPHDRAAEERYPAEEAPRLRPPTPGPASTAPAQEQEWRPGHPYGAMMRAQLGPAETFYPEDRGPEETLYQGHPSWLAYPKALLALLVLIIAAVVSHRLQFGLEWVLLFGSIAGLILLFVGLDRFTCAYFITTRRVEMEYGMLGRNTREVRIRDIRSIDVQQGGWRALLGMGNVRFDSSVSSGPEVYFKNVHGPHALKELVREMQK